MPVPIIRRFTYAAPAALNAFAYATDNESGLTFIRLTKNNVLVDVLSSPQPAAGVNYQVNLHKNFIDTGRRFYSEQLDPASAGRIAVGPIGLSPGDYSFSCAQTLGGLAAYNFVIKLADQP